MRGLFVCIIGPDGSGKTTIAKNLVAEITSRDHAAVYIWLRFESIILRAVVEVARRIRVYPDSMTESHKRSVNDKRRLFRSSIMRVAFLTLVIMRYLVSTRKGVAEPLRNHNIVVSDRYYYDTAIDLWIDFGMNDESISTITSLFEKLLPRPDIVFALDVPEYVSMSRKDDIPSQEYISIRRRGYKKMCENLRPRCIEMDGTKSVTENTQEIMRQIFEEVA